MLKKLILLFVVCMVSGAIAQGTAPDYIIYVNAQSGLSMVTFADGLASPPQVFMDAGDTPPGEYRLEAAPDKIAVFRRWESTAELSVWSVPDGHLLLQQDLVSPDFPSPPPTETGNPQAEIWRAIGEMAWSPDGNQLAFVSASDGAATVYLADFPSGTVSAISTAQGANSLLTWSPDGQWLIFSDLETLAGEAGFLSLGIYAWHQTGDIKRLELPSAYPNDVFRVGWRDGETVLIAPRSFIAGARGLYGWHIPSGMVTTYLPDTLEMTVPVYAADTIAFAVPDIGTNNQLAAGFYLLPLSTGEPQLVFEGNFFIVWLAHDRYFQIGGGLLIDAMTLEETVLLGGDIATFVSPAATFQVAYSTDGLRISSLVDNGGTVFVPVTDALPPDWLPDGTHFVTQSGSDLIMVNVIAASVRVLDSITGPWAIVGETR